MTLTYSDPNKKQLVADPFSQVRHLRLVFGEGVRPVKPFDPPDVVGLHPRCSEYSPGRDETKDRSTLRKHIAYTPGTPVPTRNQWWFHKGNLYIPLHRKWLGLGSSIHFWLGLGVQATPYDMGCVFIYRKTPPGLFTVD